MQQSGLSVKGITKRFPGVLALDEVNLEVEPGEVHVLLGENGAGKSTLMKILAGVYRPDSGQMMLGGKPYRPQRPHDALRLGVATLYQEFNLVPDLSVLENLFLGREPALAGWIRRGALRAQATALIEDLGLRLPLDTKVRDLGVAQCQMVEIAKALSLNASFLTMDEPTAALSDREIDALFGLIRRLRARGVGIVYISHRLPEITQLGDRVTVMRDGRTIVTKPLDGCTTDELIRLMVGREVHDIYPPPGAQPGPEVLRVENLRPKGANGTINFSVRAGEILGIAGLVGSGRTELLRAIFGADPKAEGRIFIKGRDVRIRNPRHAVSLGLALLPEDRKQQGLALGLSIRANVSLANLKSVTRMGWIRHRVERARAEKLATELTVKTPSIEQMAGALSGGNQQKVVIAKWLATNAEVLMFDEPTRGIDVGARMEIYRLMRSLADSGKAIVMVSSDLPEVLGMSDRILVMAEGGIRGELPRTSDPGAQETILALATKGEA